MGFYGLCSEPTLLIIESLSCSTCQTHELIATPKLRNENSPTKLHSCQKKPLKICSAELL